MRFNLQYVFISMLVIACKGKAKQEAPVPPNADSAEEKSYMPVPVFIQEDMRRIDSFAGGILLKSEEPKKKDSVFINNDILKQYAREFLIPEMDSAFFVGNFKEESFSDETTQSINFIYTTENSASQLRKVIIYLTPAGEVNKVSKIYLEKFKSAGDTTINQKLTWRMNHYFIIAESKETPAGAAGNSVKKIIWDPGDFSGE